MSTSQLRDRIAVLRAEATAVGEQLAALGAVLDPQELFEVTGELQGVANAVEGAQLVAIAHAGSHELRLTDRGPVEIHHEVGFIDAMTSSEVSLATGLGQWAAGRKVGAACDGLDDRACAAVEDVLVQRVVGMDPARITTVARKVATRIAADQVAAATAKNKKDRAVQVTPGPDGTTDWWARLPAGRPAAAWAAIRDLADRYTKKDPHLTLDQARADAFIDLLLTNVTVTAKVTLGIPVITGPDAEHARAAALAEHAAESPTGKAKRRNGGTAAGDAATTTGGEAAGALDATLGNDATAGGDGGGGGGVRTTGPARPVDDSSTVTTGPAGPGDPDPGADAGAQWVRPAVATGGLGLGESFSLSAALLSGCEIPGIGFIDADTVQALLSVVPTDIGRALLDAHTGTLIETVSTAYRPSKAVTNFVTTRDGTCRMWGCPRPATHCDIDHARPWPNGPTTPTNLGGLCRRHHRLKQRRHWTYHLAPDGTATWTSPTGTTRTTQPDHAALPPPPPPLPVSAQPSERPHQELVTA